jgi:hypothetical protein
VDGVSSEAVKVLYALLPGFVAAWVFYGLTPHPKTSSFERIVQALIFTAIIQPITSGIGWALHGIGQVVALGPWSEDCRLFWSLLVALGVGLVVACCANNDRFHSWMRKFRVTTRTSYPSEWFSAFSRHERWIVLHLSGGRRLYGWPEESPDQPDSGHFVIDQPEWLLDDGRRAPLHRVEKLLVPASCVEMVEFVKQPEEITVPPDELRRIGVALTELQTKEKDHGKQSPAAGPESATPSP